MKGLKIVIGINKNNRQLEVTEFVIFFTELAPSLSLLSSEMVHDIYNLAVTPKREAHGTPISVRPRLCEEQRDCFFPVGGDSETDG